MILSPEEQVVHVIINLQQICGQRFIVHLVYQLHHPALHGPAGPVELLQQALVVRVFPARGELRHHV